MKVDQVQEEFEKLREWLERIMDELAVWWHQVGKCSISIDDLEDKLYRERYKLYLKMLANQTRKMSLIAQRRSLVDDQLGKRTTTLASGPNRHPSAEINSTNFKDSTRDTSSNEECSKVKDQTVVVTKYNHNDKAHNEQSCGDNFEASEKIDGEKQKDFCDNNQMDNSHRIESSNDKVNEEINEIARDHSHRQDKVNSGRELKNHQVNVSNDDNEEIDHHQMDESYQMESSDDDERKKMKKKLVRSTQHQCGQCKYSFTLRGSLLRHQATFHLKKKRHQCSHCDKRFARKDYLVKHLRTHTGEKRHQCSHCDKRFARKDYLVKHLRTHTGEKPYQCDTCDKRFTERNTLNKHRKKHSV